MKQSIQTINLSKRLATLSVLLVLIVAGGTRSDTVYADQFDQQIKELQTQNIQTQSTIAQLEEQASSYQDAIDRLQAQINQIEPQIIQNEIVQKELKGKIAEAQKELDQQRYVLGRIIRSMYVDDEPSTLEQLASSKSLSDFVDKKTYRTAVQNKLQATLQVVQELQVKLTDQKAEVDRLLEDARSQQALLDANRAEQAKLLTYNQTQQDGFSQKMEANQTKIAELRRLQAALISRYQVGGTLAGDPNRGGYPLAWDQAPKDSLVDTWGMFNRECVSYTAFKVHQNFLEGKVKRDMPYWGGRGDAKKWPDNARAAGIPVDNIPTVNSIAITTSGTWGHSMNVEKVGTLNGRPAVYVSQYNADFSGRYSEGWRYTTGLQFIHF